MFAKFFKKKSQAVIKTNVTREEVERIIQRDFPAEQHNNIIKILDGFRYSEGFREVAQKMILEEAKGNTEKVKKYAEYADQVNGDYRDLAVGFKSMRTKPCNSKNHHTCNGQVRQKWDSAKGETLWVCSRCGGKYEFEVLVEKSSNAIPSICNMQLGNLWNLWTAISTQWFLSMHTSELDSSSAQHSVPEEHRDTALDGWDSAAFSGFIYAQ